MHHCIYQASRPRRLFSIPPLFSGALGLWTRTSASGSFLGFQRYQLKSFNTEPSHNTLPVFSSHHSILSKYHHLTISPPPNEISDEISAQTFSPHACPCSFCVTRPFLQLASKVPAMLPPSMLFLYYLASQLLLRKSYIHIPISRHQ